jgi:hypothetical protein
MTLTGFAARPSPPRVLARVLSGARRRAGVVAGCRPALGRILLVR